jgi:hypothetical protein
MYFVLISSGFDVTSGIYRHSRPSPFTLSVKHNLVPRACDPREGAGGSGIIRCRKPGILEDWTTHSISTANQIPPWNGLSQSLAFLPEDRRLGKRDWVKHNLVPRPPSTPIAHFCILMRWRLLRGLEQNVSSEPKVGTKCPHLLYWDQWLVKMAEFSWASKMFIDSYQIEFILRQVGLKFCGFNRYWIEVAVHKLTYWKDNV